MKNAPSIEGARFGRLTAKSICGKNKYGKYIWSCLCDCGNIIEVLRSSLVAGNTKSCGCLQSEMASKSNKESKPKYYPGATSSVEYKTWIGMKDRCFNPNSNSREDYGGRGIVVCDRWRNSFDNFLSDMGKRPGPGYSIDRIDVNGDYEPGNCRWATASEQVYNQRRYIEKRKVKQLVTNN